MNTILIVDDHALFRDGLRGIIQTWNDFLPVGEAANGQEALELCRKLAPDIVLMDIHMPVMNGIEAARQICSELPATHVIILTMSDDEKNLFDAIKAGARGYVLKDTPAHVLHDQLREAVKGGILITGPIASRMVMELVRQREDRKSVARDATSHISHRELEILQLVVDGLTNQQMAERLKVTEDTIKKHLGNVMQKLHLNNRVQAAVFALRKGLAE